MDGSEDLEYHVNLCGLCQDAENSHLITTTMISENITEHGTTHIDVLGYIFPDVEWVFNENIIPLLCKICLETIEEVADFKKLCTDMNNRRAFHKYPNISLSEKIQIELVPDGIEDAMMDRECIRNGGLSTSTDIQDAVSDKLSCDENTSYPDNNDLQAETYEHFNYVEEEVEEDEEHKATIIEENQPTEVEEIDNQPTEFKEQPTGVQQINQSTEIEELESAEVENGQTNELESQSPDLQAEVYVKSDEVVLDQVEMEEEDVVFTKNELENNCENAMLDEKNVPKIIEEKYKRSIYQAKYQPFKHETQCKECNKKFNTWTELKKHLNTNHLILRKYRCDICKLGFTGRDNLNRHIYKHNGCRNYVCLICGGKYITQGDLTEHLRFHDEVAKYKCDKCGAKFKSMSNLKSHAVVHTDPKDYKFLCVMCGNKYSCSGALSEHVQHRHNTRSISCTMCNKKFHAARDLTRHMIIHSSTFKFPCHLCETKFKRKPMLAVHLRREHGVGKGHIEDMRKFECEYCDMKFVSVAKLTRHKRTHTGMRPFKCRLCHVRFICKYYIRSHMKQKHDIDVDGVDYDPTLYYDTISPDGTINKHKMEQSDEITN